MLYTEIKDCRLCHGTRLTTVLDLGVQALTGVFPKASEADAPAGPLQLCKCDDCDLVQLKHNYDLSQMYGDNYGYRSGLNQSMVKHLHQKVAKIRTLATLNPGDLVVDIGSNDSTTLQAYPENLTLVGVDPSGPKFKQYYPAHISLIPDFFSAKLIKAAYPGKRAKVITSIAMFYDLERPQLFVNEIARRRRFVGVRAELPALYAGYPFLRHSLSRASRVLLAQADQANARQGWTQDRGCRIQ